MFFQKILLVPFLVFGMPVLLSVSACAADARPIEIYVSGVRYHSVVAYHKEKRELLRLSKMDEALALTSALRPDPDIERTEPRVEDVIVPPAPVELPPGLSIAGIEPSMNDLVETFNTTEPAVVPKQVFSAFELQDFWLEDVKNEEGPLLLIADSDKVRLMRLQKKP
jgi:hypothetical protein